MYFCGKIVLMTATEVHTASAIAASASIQHIDQGLVEGVIDHFVINLWQGKYIYQFS